MPFNFRDPSTYGEMTPGTSALSPMDSGMTPEEQKYMALYRALMEQANQPPAKPGLIDVLATVFGNVEIPYGREVPAFKRDRKSVV